MLLRLTAGLVVWVGAVWPQVQEIVEAGQAIGQIEFCFDIRYLRAARCVMLLLLLRVGQKGIHHHAAWEPLSDTASQRFRTTATDSLCG